MSTDDYFIAHGETIDASLVDNRRAKEFIRVLVGPAAEVATLLDVRLRRDPEEGTAIFSVTFELKFTRGPKPLLPIRSPERMCVLFFADDMQMPWVLCMRRNFPRKNVLHQFIMPENAPVGLCLFAEPWREIRDRIPAGEFLWRIQNWLERSANGLSHLEGQPLEPAFLGLGDVFVANTTLWAEAVSNGFAFFQRKECLFQDRHIYCQVNEDTVGSVGAMLSISRADPSEHSWIRSEPRTLKELHDLLLDHNVDLLSALRAAFVQCGAKGITLDDLHCLLLVIEMPRIMGEHADPIPQIYSFSWSDSVLNLKLVRGAIGVSDVGVDNNKQGVDLPIKMVHWHMTLTQQTANLWSNQANSASSLLAVGVGALGSQVLLNGVREGLGPWIIVENDVLLPHNLVRHSLSGRHIGSKKGDAVQEEANSIWPGAVSKVVTEDIVSAIEIKDLTTLIGEAKAIVDMSASGEVVKVLSHDLQGGPRRCSLFVTPSGDDFVFLGEPDGRSIRLDQVEAQYYAAVAQDPRLSDHLKAGRFRGTCRDQSVLLPQEMMALHSAQGTRRLRRWLGESEGTITILRSEPESQGITDIRIPLESWHEIHIGDWTVCFGENAMNAMKVERGEALPNETGGVLLGSLDVVRNKLYVSLTLPAPPDSIKKPTAFIRGCLGLQDAVLAIEAKTLSQVRYLGEWHAHPVGSSVERSSTDLEAQYVLAELGSQSGLPPLMVIVSDEPSLGVYLCQTD